MGMISSLIKCFMRCCFYITIFVAIVVLIPNLPPYSKFSTYEIEITQPKYQTLEHCTSLNNAKRILRGKIHGPEAFVLVNEELYTSLATGEVVKVLPNGGVKFITKVGQPCKEYWEEEICGRPLGLQFDEEQNKLYIADAYYGIWKVDIRTDKKQLLVSPQVEIEGQKPMFFNSIALDTNGDIYWTDSSSDFKLRDGFYCTLADPSGRLFHYNAAKNESKVLLDELGLANGLVISPNRDFVVVAETLRFRLIKYYIRGPQKGQREIFAAGLPGLPDNVQPLPDGSGMLVGLYSMFDLNYPILMRSMARTPIARKFLARTIKLMQIPFEFVNSILANSLLSAINYQVSSFKTADPMLPPLTGLVRLDWNGNIVQCYLNSDKTLSSISDAYVYNNLLYIGNPNNHYLGTVPIPKDLVQSFNAPLKKVPDNIEPKPKVVTPNVPPPKKTKPPSQPIKQETPQQAKSAEQKPKLAEQKPAPTPKPADQKPTPTPPKASEQKPAPTPKPAEQKPEPTPKPAEQKPAPTPKPAEQKPAPTPPKPAEQKPASTPKPAEQKPASTPKPADQKPASTPKPAEQKPKPAEQRPTPAQKPPVTSDKAPPKQQIPIKEDIPSDTAKPNKETIKVIKKSGPAEIPNPNL